MAWESVSAILTNVGDVTPAGVIDKWETEPEMHLVILTIDGAEYTRKFEDLVDREAK